MIQYLPQILLAFTLVASLALAFIDHKKKRKINNFPKLSVIIPTYNDGKTLEKTITSLYRVYERKKIDLIVINDNSKDNTKKILDKLKKRYFFRVIENKKNIGKVNSLNSVIKYAKRELILILDSDILLSKKAIYDMLSRLQNPKVGAVSCPYKIKKNNLFITAMMNIELKMVALSLAPYNFSSNLLLNGGCMIFKKEALRDICFFRENMLLEDMDVALRLNQRGWRVQQSLVFVETFAPQNISTWLEQKIRWAAGTSQCILTYPKVFMKNFMVVLHFILYGIISFLTIYSIFFQIHINPFSVAFMTSFYLMLLTPYVILTIEDLRKAYELFFVFPFAFFYFPVYLGVSIIGLIVGIYKFFKLKNGGRGW